MPEISRFYGIVIRMYHNDHAPPHFHAYYSGDMALVDINTLAAFHGHLPPRALGLVIEWASIHQKELLLESALGMMTVRTRRTLERIARKCCAV